MTVWVTRQADGTVGVSTGEAVAVTGDRSVAARIAGRLAAAQSTSVDDPLRLLDPTRIAQARDEAAAALEASRAERIADMLATAATTSELIAQALPCDVGHVTTTLVGLAASGKVARQRIDGGALWWQVDNHPQTV